MKKIIGIMLLLVAMMNTSALAEGFTLHNGTQFGMAKEEVIRIEKENSFDLKQDSYHDCLLSAHGKIAGLDGSLLYVFSNNSLDGMRYEFGSGFCSITDRNTKLSQCQEYFTSIENGLKSKYGDTKYNSSTLLTIPYESIPVSNFQQSTRHAYSQRLIEIGTNEYVFIDHYIYEYKIESYYSISDRVDYQYLDATSAQNLFDQLNQQQNDL